MKVVNPYTFVPFVPSVERKPYTDYFPEPVSELKSGYLDVEIITKTHLIIPDSAEGVESPENGYMEYPFFRMDGKPVIPGSEIRGMLRNVYEAATNSCLPFLPDNQSFSLRTPVSGAFKYRGLLEHANGKWKLYKAIVYRKKVWKHDIDTKTGKWNNHSNAEKVSFIPRGNRNFELVSSTTHGCRNGYLQFNIPIKDPYNVAVLEPDRSIYTWDDNTPYKALMESLSCHGDPYPFPTRDLRTQLNNIGKPGTEGMIPVWYLKIIDPKTGQSEYYLSGSSIGRVHQQRSWQEIIGEHRPCHSLNSLCPACALFGTVADGGCRSRVRFYDAHLEGKAELSYRTLSLASPKHTAYAFYLERPVENTNYWNYDYHCIREYNSQRRRKETTYKKTDPVVPRGRKFYWHHDKAKPENINPDNININTTMEAIAPGARFVFRLSFDRISELQLNQLLWVINFGENNESSKLMHKLGHAKPLGYGSVKLRIREGTIRTLYTDESGQIVSDLVKMNEFEANPFKRNEDPIMSILAVVNSGKTEGLQIDYPRGQGHKIFTWFAKNQGKQVLPRPTDPDITLNADNLPL